MFPPSLNPGSHTGRVKFDGTRKTPRAPEKGRRACRKKNGAMLHRGRLGVGRSSVAHNLRPAETTQLRSEHCAPTSTATTYRRWLGCGVAATELPAPASSCRHTAQVHCSDLLRVFQRRLEAAARMQKQAWLLRVFQRRLVAAARTQKQAWSEPTHAPICTEHAEDILDRPTSRIPQRAGNLRERVTCV